MAYGLTAEQMEIADEMMSPDYYALYAELLGVDLLGGANLTQIISNLPVCTQGADVVKVALTKLGSPYVMGAKGPNKFDCSGLVYWAINEADPELGSIMYTNAAGQAKWCIENGKVVGRSELQPGDLIFWQNLNCPGCGRWNEVHHVGIYVGDGKAIEASSSRGRVVVRDLWSSASYPLYAFARPYV
jgi:cell wall-associated NlpC family hydrolase